MNSWTFTIQGPPVACERPRVVAGRAFTPSKTSKAERAIGSLAQLVGIRVESCCRITIAAFFADLRRRDLDNVAKTVLDGLAPVLPDDNWTVVRELRITGALDRANPRTVVTVELIDG